MRAGLGRSNTSSSTQSMAFLELLHLRPVVVDHGVHDPVEERDRPFAEHRLVSRRLVAQVERWISTPRRAR